MSDPQFPSRRRLAFVTACTALGAVAAGYRIVQGERGGFVLASFVCFLAAFALTAVQLRRRATD